MARVSRRRRRLRSLALVLLFGVLGLAGFGLSGTDYAALLAFSQGVDRWQVNPDFRTAAREYCVLGSGGLQARPLGLDAGAAMMKLRALPWIPKGFKVNPTSQVHYDNFSAGPLRAYLHLCSEQDLPGWIPVIEEFARKTGKTPDDYKAWLAARQMDYTVAHDDGAARSMAMLLEETDAASTYAIRQNIHEILRPRIAELARGMNFPPEPEKMTIAQQTTVLDRLDGFLKMRDADLWRTKQVNDFCGGIWAQVYGPPYNVVLVPVTRGHLICRYLFTGLMLIVLSSLLRRVRKLAALTDGDSASQDSKHASNSSSQTQTAVPQKIGRYE